jgi:ribosomal protein L9
MSVLKRKRESEKAEKAQRKREIREMEKDIPKQKVPHSGEATQDDLEAYGMVHADDEEDEEEEA